MDYQGIIMVVKNRPFLRGMMVILGGGVDTLRFPADDSQLVSVSHRISTLPVWCLSPCLRHFSPQSRDCFVKVSSSKGLACDAFWTKRYIYIFTDP